LNIKLKISLIAGLGVAAGLLAILLGKLEPAWLLAFSIPVIFPIFVVVIGSLKHSLMALLVFSLSLQMSFNPFYSSTQIGITISLTGLILYVIYSIWFVMVLVGKKGPPRFGLATLGIAVLFGWAGLSLAMAVKPSFALLKYVNAVECLLIYFYALNFNEGKEDIEFIKTCVHLTMAVTASVAIGQFFVPGLFQWEFLGWNEEPLRQFYFGRFVLRPSAFLVHPNNLATYLVVWLPLVLVSIIKENGICRRVIYITCFGLGCVALVFTFSRGGWLSFISAILLILMYYLFKRSNIPPSKKIVVTVSLCFVTALIIAPFYGAIQDRLSRDDYGSGRARFNLANDAFQLIKEKPAAGRGLGFYEDFKPIPPHNIYLQTAAEMGIIGLFLFAMVIIIFLRQGYLAIRNADRDMSLSALGLVAGLCGFCIHGMFELGTIGDSKFLSFFFIGGLLAAMGKSFRGKASQ
jgi:putative inorganic carbon (HCO3(-)) transporter